MSSDVTVPVRASSKAFLALILGLPPLNLITLGLPALFLGFSALREINQSDGRLAGRRAAVAGMVLGALGLGGILLWGVIAVLVHLREVSDRALCQNNLRVIGLATNLYYDDNEVYPPGAIPNFQLPPEQRLSWFVAVMPYLPAEPGNKGVKPIALYQKINLHVAWNDPANQDAINPPVRWFICRSDPGASTEHRPGRTSYVGIAGVGVNAAELPPFDTNAGVLGYDRQIIRDEVSSGLSTTMLATETTLHNGPWAAGGPPTLRGLIPDQQPYVGFGRPFGGCHPGGINMLFLDGRVDFIKDTISGDKFQALATIKDD